MQTENESDGQAGSLRGRFIYMACPWTPMGGGMFKVADYLIQAQSFCGTPDSADLRPLDTRGGAGPVYSLVVLFGALTKLVRGRIGGKLAGVHVNMAERLSVFRKGMIIVMCRVLGVPVVLHLHAAEFPQFYASLPWPLRAMTRWLFSLPASCLVLGASARRFVIDELNIPASQVEVVNNGVPEPHARRRVVPVPTAAGIKAGHVNKRVLFVGNLSERKGVSDLLQALASADFDASGVEVTIAGGGDVEAYRKKAQLLGIGTFVRFEGWCEQKKVATLMAAADVLTLPSYDEGLPLVILEALANGVAVVSTPVGEIPNVLTDGVTALLVLPGDVQGLAAALQRVLTDSPLRQTLERNGRALYEAHFSLSHFFASVARIHQRDFGVAAYPSYGASAAAVSRP